MRRLYSLLAYAAVLPLLAYLWWRGRKDVHYRHQWRQRFGFAGMLAGRRGAVMVHCASVGEVLAARPLIDRLLADDRWGRPLLTCSTPTGARQIRKEYSGRVDLLYFPFDLPSATRRFLSALRPRLVILLERELWPNFLHQAQCHGVPVVLVNARLSEKSAAGYARWQSIMRPALAGLRLVCAEDDAAAARFSALGVAPERLVVTGNIKSDVRIDATLSHKVAQLRRQWGTRPVLTAGSTHAEEDESLIDALRAHLQQSPGTLLVLVPRHPERFDAVARLLAQAGVRFVRHSRGENVTAATQVLLGDTMGELMVWYGVADACFVGGSLVPRGGHNPLEVMCLDKPVISGPHTHNFERIYQALDAARASLRVSGAHAVFQLFHSLMQDASAAASLVARAREVYRSMAGATDRTMVELAAHVTTAPRPVAEPLAATTGRDTVWVDAACFSAADTRLLDVAWWQDHGSAEARRAGRGQVHQVADTQRRYLLRHYHRGGLMARFSRDLFLAQRLAHSRAMAEFALLRELRARGLPVPRACAARHRRVGPWYRADILVELIPQAKDVASILARERALRRSEWQALGAAVRRLHDAQVFHADLNCHNLMLDADGQAWIVDFDKCGFRAGDGWKQANLERLQRSLRKEARLDPAVRWNDALWDEFLAGYRQSPATVLPAA